MVNFVKMSDVDTSGRLREVDQDHVEVMVASLLEIGPQQPIIVRPIKDGPFGFRLVMGAHRLAAFAALGWSPMEVGKHVVIAEMTDDEARLAEIDENLARHELNALDRAMFLLERKGLYHRLYPETGRGRKRPNTGLFREPFSKHAEKTVGLSKTAVNLATDIASKLDPEAVRALRGTKIARNQRELFAVSRLSADEQRDVANSIRRGYAKTTAQARVHLGLSNAPAVADPQARLFAVAIDAWTKMDRVTRATFLDKIDCIYKPEAPAKGGKK